jgi:hypothetical protein
VASLAQDERAHRPASAVGHTWRMLDGRAAGTVSDGASAVPSLRVRGVHKRFGRLDQVFALADHIAVLREGRIQAVASPREVHPDDVVAMMSGIETVSAACRQLRRLHSLVEQLADVAPAASLPLIVSAMAEALGVHQLCVHLLDESDDVPLLRRSATVGLALDGIDGIDVLDELTVGEGGGPPGVAAATGDTVVVEDSRRDPLWGPLRNGGHGLPRSSWSVPIVGAAGVLLVECPE